MTYAGPKDARKGLTRYLDFYNYERPHQALDYRTPAEVYYNRVKVHDTLINSEKESLS
ncbi:MAG: integrase core domain-containing protein [Anaerolineales bacterium]|nr:integrase core domain-containing protein [Anaerolineales bacterium]